MASTMVEPIMMAQDTVVHPQAVWRARADFIIVADISEESLPGRWEQLWARQLADHRFEICCIPFFAYDISLGDVVETGPIRDRQYAIMRVVQRSGHTTFRAWLGDRQNVGLQQGVGTSLSQLGALLEWYSPNLLAIDAETEVMAQEVADYLYQLEEDNKLEYETGRTA